MAPSPAGNPGAPPNPDSLANWINRQGATSSRSFIREIYQLLESARSKTGRLREEDTAKEKGQMLSPIVKNESLMVAPLNIAKKLATPKNPKTTPRYDSPLESAAPKSRSPSTQPKQDKPRFKLPDNLPVIEQLKVGQQRVQQDKPHSKLFEDLPVIEPLRIRKKNAQPTAAPSPSNQSVKSLPQVPSPVSREDLLQELAGTKQLQSAGDAAKRARRALSASAVEPIPGFSSDSTVGDRTDWLLNAMEGKLRSDQLGLGDPDDWIQIDALLERHEMLMEEEEMGLYS
jgi:hypothetical protein